MLRLNKLEVRHVRGIAGSGPDLELGGKSLILLGDNATGKSSYIDALEYLLTRHCSSIDIDRQGVNWEDGGIHILAATKDMSIKGELTDGTNPYWLDHKTDLSTLTPPLKPWIKAAQQRCFLLRRRTLLGLIEAKPKERYEALAPFFALDRFTDYERGVKTLADELDSAVKAATRTATTEEEVLRRAFNIAPGAGIEAAGVFGAVNQRLAAVKKGAVQDVDASKRMQAETEAQMKAFSGVDQAVKLETVVTVTVAVPAVRASIEALEALIGMQKSLEELEARLSKGFSVEVLENGKKWIIEGDLGECPLCEQGLPDREKVLARIAARVQECSAVIEARRSALAQAKFYSEAIIELGKGCGAAQKVWTEKLGEDPAPLSAALGELRRLVKAFQQGFSAAQLQEHLTVLKALDLDAIVLALAERARTQLKGLGGMEDYRNLSAANQALATVSVSWPALLAARTVVARKQDRKKIIDKVLASAIQARKDTVQAILVSIADEANKIYKELHPDEKIGDVTLKVPNRGEGSVNMESQFFAKRADARLYFSESHLDTLGVALFLALRKKQAIADPQFKLLVLDDVFHSVDARHRDRAARLLIREFKDHQFLITTHDPIWFKLLGEAVEAEGLREKVAFRRISDWSLEQGPIWGDEAAEYAFLTSQKVDQALPADLAAKAGRLLEEILKPLCDQLKVSVQYRYNRRYDLGALWPGFRSKAGAHEGFSAQHMGALEEIDRSEWVRNETGAHSNESAAPTTTEEAKRFAKAVVALVNATKGAKCGRYIEEVSAPKGDWVCRCGTHRYPRKVAPQASSSSTPPVTVDAIVADAVALVAPAVRAAAPPPTVTPPTAAPAPAKS
ncbi:MAG: hypothetical protein AB1725_11475 [Armatimonadota bacterium]|jgi:recombinational DNA repair ATPase RecF